MTTVISAEGLSKRYLISHHQKEPYTALRDVLAQGIKRRAKELLHWTRIQQLHSATSQEEFWALNDISFQIRQGERVGIIGRNGAGKSTLLKIISRIIEPTKGRLTVKGRVASLLEVGTGFHPELTGRENIFLNGAILGMSRQEIQRKFDAIVEFSGVEKFLDTPVKRYSSGMYTRLAFSVAAHLDSDILIVDEVLAVGDTQFQKKCLGKMEDVGKRDGRTVLFVSHNMNIIKGFCEACYVLDAGSLVMAGNTAECIKHYINEIFAGGSQTFQSVLAATRDDPVCEISSFTVTQNGIPTEIVESDHETIAEITYQIKQPEPSLLVAIDLCNEFGDLILRSHFDRHNGLTSLASGKYRSSVTIPPNILGPRNYIIRPRVTLHKKRFILDPTKIYWPLSVTHPKKDLLYYYASNNFTPALDINLRWNTTCD
jgi:lipopolysaccharide transport system ATP-binding protein